MGWVGEVGSERGVYCQVEGGWGVVKEWYIVKFGEGWGG